MILILEIIILDGRHMLMNEVSFLVLMEQQLDSIPGMLRDDLADVRRFGVDRVAVLLRDGQATTAIEEAVLESLEDSDL